MDKRAFAERVHAMQDRLYRIASGQLRGMQDREDAVQETIRRAWEKRGQLRDERYMQTWVIRILLNVCDSLRRRAARMVPAEYLTAVHQDLPQETPLLDALFSLEEKFRLPVRREINRQHFSGRPALWKEKQKTPMVPAAFCL